MNNAIREYFPGSNTPKGFYSYYDQILHSDEADRIIILKGGPGTGKSTFMRRVASHLDTLGYETELLHCSSDPDSLDGVCARAIGFLIVDGTSPHIIDAKFPGAIEQIINLGEYWNADKIKENKQNIMRTSKNISEYFKNSYEYLAAAKTLQERTDYEFDKLLDDNEINKITEDIKREFSLYPLCIKTASERKAFLCAITPYGKIEYTDSFSKNAKKVYKIKADCASHSSHLLHAFKELFLKSGYDVRTFYSSMSPDVMLEHLYVPEVDVFFTTKNKPNSFVTEEITLSANLKDKNISLDIYSDLEMYNLLIKRATTSIANAKHLHDELEAMYVPFMNFGEIESLCDSVIMSIK